MSSQVGADGGALCVYRDIFVSVVFPLFGVFFASDRAVEARHAAYCRMARKLTRTEYTINTIVVWLVVAPFVPIGCRD